MWTGVDRHVVAIMSKFDRQTAESDESFLAFEEKRMKLEEEMEERRRVWEEEQMMRMQQMFAQQMQQMMLALTGYPPPFPQYPTSSCTHPPVLDNSGCAPALHLVNIYSLSVMIVSTACIHIYA